MKQEQKASVTVTLCEDGLFWGADAVQLNTVDEEASFDKFFDLVKARLEKEFEGDRFSLSVEKGAYDKNIVNAPTINEEDIEDTIFDIVQRTYADDHDQWVVYKDE